MTSEIANLSLTIIGAATILVAAVIGTMVQHRRARLQVMFANEAIHSRPNPVAAAVERLQELNETLERQKIIAYTNRWMSRLLTVGQYIVGGLLASSFVQESLSHEMVGALGLLVLVSSLIYQHFRPDIQLRGAMGRILRLRALSRAAGDDIHAMRENSPDAPTVDEFRRKISSALSDIEASEFQDVTARSGNDSNTTQNS